MYLLSRLKVIIALYAICVALIGLADLLGINFDIIHSLTLNVIVITLCWFLAPIFAKYVDVDADTVESTEQQVAPSPKNRFRIILIALFGICLIVTVLSLGIWGFDKAAGVLLVFSGAFLILFRRAVFHVHCQLVKLLPLRFGAYRPFTYVLFGVALIVLGVASLLSP